MTVQSDDPGGSASPGRSDEPSRYETILDGLTVIDVTMNYAGPFATLILSDLGARVIKIEPPGTGDSSRTWAPIVEGKSAAFASMNRGKESLAVDLRDPQGVEVVRRLVDRADVFVQSLRPGASDSLGIGAEEVRARNERIIYCDISAFGAQGPLGGSGGYDAIVQAYSGIMGLTGYPDAPPARVGTGIVDFGTGLWVACGVLAGLLEREQTGRGVTVTTTMLGSAMSFIMHHLMSVVLAGAEPQRLGTAQHNAAPYEAIRAADGMVMVAAGNDRLFERLCVALEAVELLSDARFTTNSARVANRDELVEDLSRRIADVSGAEVVERLRGHEVPASRVRSVGELVDDPQAEAAGLWRSDPSGAQQPALPIRLDGEPWGSAPAVPDLGRDTDAILRELGYAGQAIDELHETGVVGTVDTAG